MVTYEDEIAIIEGTFGKDVNLQALDADDNPVSLADCTVRWIIYKEETSVLDETCTPDDLPLGKVKYPLKETDWGTAKLEGGQEYDSSLLATKEGYQEEFKHLRVRTLKKAPGA